MKLTEFHETITNSMTLSNAAKVNIRKVPTREGLQAPTGPGGWVGTVPVDRTLSHVDEGRCTRGMDQS